MFAFSVLLRMTGMELCCVMRDIKLTRILTVIKEKISKVK